MSASNEAVRPCESPRTCRWNDIASWCDTCRSEIRAWMARRQSDGLPGATDVMMERRRLESVRYIEPWIPNRERD